MDGSIVEEIKGVSETFSNFRSVELGQHTPPHDYATHVFLHNLSLEKILALEDIIVEIRAIIYRIYDVFNQLDPKAVSMMVTLNPEERDQFLILKTRKEAATLANRVLQWKEKNRANLKQPRSFSYGSFSPVVKKCINASLAKMALKIVGNQE